MLTPEIRLTEKVSVLGKSSANHSECILIPEARCLGLARVHRLSLHGADSLTELMNLDRLGVLL